MRQYFISEVFVDDAVISDNEAERNLAKFRNSFYYPPIEQALIVNFKVIVEGEPLDDKKTKEIINHITNLLMNIEL